MKRSLYAAALACAAVLFATALTSAANVKHSPFPPSLQGEPLFVRVHAAWCTECKATQPTIDQIHRMYGSRLHYVDFDVTDAKTSAVAAATAKRLNLTWLYEHDKTLPSSVTIINPSSGRMVARFWNDSNPQDYIDAITRVIRELNAR